MRFPEEYVFSITDSLVTPNPVRAIHESPVLNFFILFRERWVKKMKTMMRKENREIKMKLQP